MRENRLSGLMRGGTQTVIGFASQSVASRLLYRFLDRLGMTAFFWMRGAAAHCRADERPLVRVIAAPQPHEGVGEGLLEDAAVAVARGQAEDEAVAVAFGLKRG